MKKISFNGLNILLSDEDYDMLVARFDVKNAVLFAEYDYRIWKYCLCHKYFVCSNCPFYRYGEGIYGRIGCRVILEDYIFENEDRFYFNPHKVLALSWTLKDDKKARKQIKKVHTILMSAKDEKK